MVRRLGQPEAAAQYIHLGINYHLDSYLDDDEARFSMEFPQVRALQRWGCWRSSGGPCYVHAWVHGCTAGTKDMHMLRAQHFSSSLQQRSSPS